jgi:phosphohistidine phosphatase
MRLLLVRHAIAEDAEQFAKAGGTDAERPLTESGRKRMRKGANRLRSQLNTIDLLVSSPLLRARETAEIVARAFGNLPVSERPDLAPDNPLEPILTWLATTPTIGTLALVGHVPQLTLLAGMLITGMPQPLFTLKKGGVALLDFTTTVESGSGRLVWLLTSAQLRSLKD